MFINALHYTIHGRIILTLLYAYYFFLFSGYKPKKNKKKQKNRQTQTTFDFEKKLVFLHPCHYVMPIHAIVGATNWRERERGYFPNSHHPSNKFKSATSSVVGDENISSVSFQCFCCISTGIYGKMI